MTRKLEIQKEIQALDKRIDEAIAWYEKNETDPEVYYNEKLDCMDTNNKIWGKFRSLLQLRAKLDLEIDKLREINIKALELW